MALKAKIKDGRLIIQCTNKKSTAELWEWLEKNRKYIDKKTNAEFSAH